MTKVNDESKIVPMKNSPKTWGCSFREEYNSCLQILKLLSARRETVSFGVTLRSSDKLGTI